jgi:hypothetical protein
VGSSSVIRAPTVYESLYNVSDDADEVHRRLAYWLEEYWQANQAKIDILGRYYFAAAIALVFQLVFWSWALAANIS